MPSPATTLVKRLVVNSLASAENQIINAVIPGPLINLDKVTDGVIRRVIPTVESANVLNKILADAGIAVPDLGAMIIQPIIPSVKVAQELSSLKPLVGALTFGPGAIAALGMDVLKPLIPSVKVAQELNDIKSLVSGLSFGASDVAQLGLSVLKPVIPSVKVAEALNGIKPFVTGVSFGPGTIADLGISILKPIIPSINVAQEMGNIKSLVTGLSFGASSISGFGVDILKRAVPSVACAAKLNEITSICGSFNISSIFSGGVSTLAAPFLKIEIPSISSVSKMFGVMGAAGPALGIMQQVAAVGQNLTGLIPKLPTSVSSLISASIPDLGGAAASFVTSKLGADFVAPIVDAAAARVAQAAADIAGIQSSIA